MASKKFKDKGQIDIILIGKTGSGKSATCNTILGREAFVSSPDSNSVTREVDYDVVKFDGRVIKVVDTPGLSDTKEINDPLRAQRFVMEKMSDAVWMQPSGYSAFLLVIKFGTKFSAEEHNCITLLKQIFGPKFVKKYCIMIITSGDNFLKESNRSKMTFDQWIKNQEGVLRELFKECQNRVILTDNFCDSEGRVRFLRQLMSIVDNVSHSNNGKRYTNKHFKAASKSRLHAVKEHGYSFLEEILNKERLILDEMQCTLYNSEAKSSANMHALTVQNQELIDSLGKIQDKNSLLTEAYTMLCEVSQTISLFINTLSPQRSESPDVIQKDKTNVTESSSSNETSVQPHPQVEEDDHYKMEKLKNELSKSLAPEILSSERLESFKTVLKDLKSVFQRKKNVNQKIPDIEKERKERNSENVSCQELFQQHLQRYDAVKKQNNATLRAANKCNII